MKSSSLVWACTFFATPIAFTPVTLGRTLEDLISAVTCQDLTKVKELGSWCGRELQGGDLQQYAPDGGCHGLHGAFSPLYRPRNWRNLSLHIKGILFLHVLFHNFSCLIPNHDPMPFGFRDLLPFLVPVKFIGR